MDGAVRWLRWFRKLYSLDTLDTRFTVPSNTPPRGAVTELQIDPVKSSPDTSNITSKDTQDGRTKIATNAPHSLWKTTEFYFYYFIFITVIPVMFYVPYNVSKTSHPSYDRYSQLLSPGWIPGRKVDNSDGQYANFRNNVPVLAILLVVHPLLRRLYDAFWRSNTYTAVKPIPSTASSSSPSQQRLTHGLSSTAAGHTRLEQRVSFDFYFAIIFITALHGFSALKILLILWVNYKIAIRMPRQYVPAITWAYCMAVLFANELCAGYSFATFARYLTFTSSPDRNANMMVAAGSWLDSHGGINPRWEVLFNITVLRLISFTMDYCWAQDMRTGGSPIEKKQLDASNLSARDRVSMPAKSTEYSLRNYIAYALYSPLFLAGPIVTFNDYISQSKFSPGSITKERTFLYAIRFVVCLLTMEVILHFIYTVAIFKAKPDWDSFSPFQLSMLGYFNLTIIWLKLLIPWRFFRLWSLIDDIDPPENMTRCMSNNYSTFAFWRGWHRSFNRWIVRYIYIPMGGSDYTNLKGGLRSLVNVMFVFSFVAIWHDINLRLLQWGWLISLFLLPEFLATLAFPAKKWRNSPNAWRWLCGVGAVGNILMMMVANLVGFAIGVDGLQGLVHGIVGNIGGWTFFFGACACLFVGAQVMFETRMQERREGIKMNC